MSDDLTFGVRLDGSGNLASEARVARDEIDALKKSAGDLAGASKENWAEVQRSANASAQAWKEGNAEADAAADKAWALANGYKEVGGQIVRSAEQGAAGMSGLGLNTQYARREMMQLGKEALTGDFSRMPRTFGALVTHSNLLQAAMSPLGAAIAAAAATAAALGVSYAGGAREMRAMNDAMLYTGNYAGVTRGHMIALAEEISRTSTLTVGVAKDVVTHLVDSGRIGAESLGAIARMADTYAAATGKNIDKIGADLAKLFDDPAKGAEVLNSRLHFLNASELEYIGHLVRIGEEEKARLVLAESFNASVPKHVENIGWIEAAWDKAAKKAASYWDTLKGAGRDSTVEENLKRNAKLIAEIEGRGGDATWMKEIQAREMELYKQQQTNANERSEAAKRNSQQIAAQALVDKKLGLDRIREKEDEITRLDKANQQELVDTEQYLKARRALENELSDLKKPKAQEKAKHDPNDTAVAALQAEQFRKQMELMGVAVEQVKVYELAMKGATKAQIDNAQASANAIAPLNAELKARKELEKQLEESARKAAADAKRKESEDEAEAKRMARAVINENARTALINAAAGQRDKSAQAREEHRYQVEKINAQRRFDLLKLNHILTEEAEEAHQAEMDAIEERHANNKKTAQLDSTKFVLAVKEGEYTQAMDLAANMTAGLAAHSKAAFEINKVASIASAIMHTYTAVAGVLKEFPGPTGWAMAAIQGAMGFAQVSAIASTSFGGGGGSASAVGGGGSIPSLATSPGVPVSVQNPTPPQSGNQPPALGQAAPAPQQINLTIVGNEKSTFTYDQIVNQLVPLINQAAGNGVNIKVQMA